MILSGKAWVFGDGVGATDLVSAHYDEAGMSRDWAECRKHLLEDIDPNFNTSVRPGDLIIAGNDLGRGHAHYYTAAIMACRTAGVGALLGESVNALFQRCAIDQGFLAWALPGIGSFVASGDQIEIDLASGAAINATSGVKYQFDAVSPLILDIIGAGGSLDWALGRVGAAPIAA